MSKLVKLFVLLVSLTGLGLWGGNALAATCTTNAGTGTWGTSGTWSCGHVPVAADTVVISRNITAVTTTIAGLTVNAGASLNGNNKNLTVAGAVTISGTYNTAGGNLTTTGAGALTVNTGGTFDFNNGNAAISGNVAINGTLSSGGDNLQMTGAGTSLSGTGNVVNTTIEIDATGVSVPVGANLVFDANSQIDVAANVSPASLTVNGTIDGTAQAAGDRIIRVSTGGSLTVGSTGVINAPNSRLDVRNGASATNNGTIIIGELIGRTGTPVPVFTQGANSTLNVSGPVCTAACVLNASEAGNIVNYTGAAQTVYLPSGSTYANLTLSGSGPKTMPATAITVTGNFTISGTAAVTATAALTVGGNWTETGTYTPGSRTVTLNGANAQTISGTSPVNFYNLTVTNGASPNITLASDVMVANTLTGTVTLTPNCAPDYTLTSISPAQTLHSCPPAPPTVISIAPASGPTAGGTAVTITGTNFTGATAVTIGGTSATSIVVSNTTTTITAVTPAGTAGARDVVVTTPGGTGTGTGLFTYVAPPTVTSIAPNTGSTLGGTAVTITGTNLTGATVYTVGGASLTGVTVMNATTITGTTPAGTAGVKDVVVTTPYGTGTGTGLFTYLAAPIAEYRFDEGSAGSVTDSSGNSLSGTLNGGVTVGGTGKICTGYNFNGSNAFVSVPNTALLNPTQTTVAAWVRHNTATIKNWEAILAKGDSAYRLHLLGASGCSINGNNTLGAFSFAVNGGCAGADVSSGIVPVAGTWYHVVGTYDGATIKIYVNGALQASGAYVSTIASNIYPLNIGENAQQTGRYWSGDIDEVKIYGVALSAGQIAAGYANESAGKNWDGTTRVCLISAPHHLEIRHASGTGLTCAASTLTVVACQDVACATPYTGGVSGTLSATGTPTVNWDGSTGGAAGAGFVIPAGSSSVTKNVQVATAGSVVFGITSPAPAPSNVTTCNFGSPACTFTANTAGFIYSNSTTGSSYTIPPQFSGSAATGLYLRAVQASTTNPAVCTPAIISSTTSVNMGYACNNPTTCQAGNLATINATAIAPGGTSVSLNFDANGSAPITARYDDVGQITLNANATVTPLFTGATSVALNGSSNPYVVAPHHFGFSNITSGLIKAGNNFSATVTAYNGLATATPTANFGKETTPEGVTVSFNKCQPTGAGSSNGTFSGSVGSFNNGAASAINLNWSEVGNGDLVATLTSGSYLSSLLTATGNTGTGGTVCSAGAGNVGRFIPHHFDTVITQPGTTFTYSGQPFTTKVTAMNSAGTPTTNYNATAGFSKDVTLSAWDSTGVTANPGPGALTPTQPAAIVLASAFTLTSPGAATVTTPTYTFTAAKTVPTTIRIRATDTDAVSSSDGVTEGTAVIRSGRLRVSNAFGSEKSNLSMAVSAEYWTGLSWLLNSDDNVSLIPTTAVALTPSGVVGSTVQGNVMLVSGQASIVLLKPTSGTGMVDLAINLGSGTADLSCLTTHPATTGAGLPWLRSLNGSCAATYDRDPSARATFGIYSPETRKTIHVRELY